MSIFAESLLHNPFQRISQQTHPSMGWAQTPLTCAFPHSGVDALTRCTTFAWSMRLIGWLQFESADPCI